MGPLTALSQGLNYNKQPTKVRTTQPNIGKLHRMEAVAA